GTEPMKEAVELAEKLEDFGLAESLLRRFLERERPSDLSEEEDREGRVWAPTDWDVPSPESIPAPDREGRPTMWDTRPISGDFGALLQKRTWLRENRDLVAGEPLTPFIRAAVACDFTNPFANSGERGLEFVNADITLYLHRLPASEWLGFEVNTHHSHQGIAVAECTLYDVGGALGLSAVCGVGQRRRPSPSGRRD
ncbi:thioesterase family protein, partial [bacterium]|nr:thioesterase family protein [bacterium]